MPTLFDPLKLGALTLPNRIVMAPLTRSRAHPDTRVPTDLAVEYYRQRAGAGLIITEATSVTPMGVGYAATPGIWSDEQTEGWKKITSAVHGAGGRMLLQLWHVGRISDPMFLNGALPVAPSAIKPKGHVSLVRPEKEYVTPRALETDEIPGIIAAYRKGAENAKAAGFDGVEIHGANGYLLDQFLQDTTNHRTDAYGGTREKRARLMLEVADAVIEVWGADRVGMHLAPRMDSHDMGDSDPLAHLHLCRARAGQARAGLSLRARSSKARLASARAIKEAFGGVFIANEGFTRKAPNRRWPRARPMRWRSANCSSPIPICRSDSPTTRRSMRGTPAPSIPAAPSGYTDYPAPGLPEPALMAEQCRRIGTFLIS